MSKRKLYKPAFKAKVSPEALKGEQRVLDLASRFGAHPTMTHQWKRALIEGAPEQLERAGDKMEATVAEGMIKALHAKIGELIAANDFCPKSSNLGPANEALDGRNRSVGSVNRATVPASVVQSLDLLCAAKG